MKKLFAILLAVTMLASMATVVSAAENTTTLTTTVPSATYTLNIPADQEIEFGALYTNIGEIEVTDAEGFAEGKDLKVTITYTDFASDSVATKIPFTLHVSDKTQFTQLTVFDDVESGSAITFRGQADGTTTKWCDSLRNKTWIRIDSADWGKALAGEYTATITFTAEVVVEQ